LQDLEIRKYPAYLLDHIKMTTISGVRETSAHKKKDSFWVVPTVGFLITIALTLLIYPNLPQDIIVYFKTFERYGGPVLPPYNIGQALIFFFSISGMWGLVAASLRYVFRHPVKKVVEDVMGSFFAFILSAYYAGTITGRKLILLFIVGLIAVIAINVIASVATSYAKKGRQGPIRS